MPWDPVAIQCSDTGYSGRIGLTLGLNSLATRDRHDVQVSVTGFEDHRCHHSTSSPRGCRGWNFVP